MAIPQHVWNQLKSLTADDLIAALETRWLPARSRECRRDHRFHQSRQSEQTHRHSLPSAEDVWAEIAKGVACGYWMERSRYAAGQTDQVILIVRQDTAPKGGFIMTSVAVCLKAYPDTNLKS